MEGTVRSFVKDKQYGFIDGEDGISYFFHLGGFKKHVEPEDVKLGMHVKFDPDATPKGMKAKRLSIHTNLLPYYEMPKNLVVSRTDKPKYGKVLCSIDEIECEGSSPDEAKEKLFNELKSLNANAALSLTYRKSKGYCGNYIYSIHHYSAKGAIVVNDNATTDKNKSEESIAHANTEVDVLNCLYAEYLNKLEEERQLAEEKSRVYNEKMRIKKAKKKVNFYMLCSLFLLFLIAAASG